VEPRVREARPDDAESIVRILNAIIEAGTFTVLDTPFTVEAERHFIESFPPRGIFHVAEDRADGRLLGFQDVSPFADYTHAFDHVGVIGTFVDLERRRQGIAARLSTRRSRPLVSRDTRSSSPSSAPTTRRRSPPTGARGSKSSAPPGARRE